MSKSKKAKYRGRPPKYVLDDNGKEVVGLSYNHTNGMYYATGTNPRYYFTGCHTTLGKKNGAIKQFYEWKKAKGYTPEEIEEQKRRNEVHLKAVRLIEEGLYDEQLEKRTRELIANDYYVKEHLLERAAKLVTGERVIKDDPNHWGAKGKYEYKIRRLINKEARESAKIWINNGLYDKDIWERAYDLITKHPTKAAKILGIKEIAYVNVRYEIPLSWGLAWSIFYSHKDKKDFLYEARKYFTIREKMSMILGNPLLSNIKEAELSDALLTYPPIRTFWSMDVMLGRKAAIEDAKKSVKELMDTYSKIPMEERLEILEDVFTTAKNAGYNQVAPILGIVRALSYKL